MGMKFDMSAFAKSLGNVSESDHEETLVYIPLADLTSDEKNFYALSEISELAANIELCGLQQPLRVRRDGDKFRIVSGHRRRAALEQLVAEGKEKFASVPCIEETDEVSPAMQELRLIFANSATRKLSPADLAQQAERVEALLYQLKEEGVEFPGRMRDQVAAACQTTSTKLAELKVIRGNLREPFQSQFKENLLTQSAAYNLARLPIDVQIDLAETLGPKAKPIAGTAAEKLLQKYERYYEIEEKTVCNYSGTHCNNAKGFLKATAKSAYSWQYCDGNCCCDCRNRHECAGACAEAKKLNKQDAEDKVAAKKRAEAKAAKEKEQRKAANQKEAQRLLRAAEAAGLSDDFRVNLGYVDTVDRLKKWAMGEFGKTEIYSGNMLRPYGVEALCAAAKNLGCSTDFILGVSDELNHAAPCEGQMYLAAWMPGGAMPAHSCMVVMEFDMGEGGKINKMLGQFNAAAGRFEFKHGEPISMEPIRWIALPD